MVLCKVTDSAANDFWHLLALQPGARKDKSHDRRSLGPAAIDLVISDIANLPHAPTGPICVSVCTSLYHLLRAPALLSSSFVRGLISMAVLCSCHSYNERFQTMKAATLSNSNSDSE